MPSTTENPHPEEFRLGAPLPREAIVRGLDRLVAERKLFGADLRPDILKKEGSSSKFLVSTVPPRARLLSRWTELFRNLIAPDDFFALLSTSVHEFDHRDNMLLFGKDRVIYDTRIHHGDEPIGEMTLYFYAVFELRLGLLAYLRGKRRRIVYIEQIQLREQSSGYASALFRRYETLFRSVGFNEFRLKASLSVGKYYWAKEGFDCLEKTELEGMKAGLRALVKERGLPVADMEINRLNHAYDIALFRRETKLPVYRNREGYYSLERDGEHVEESRFPLGKAFLLTSAPWDGHKVIYTNTPRRTGIVYADGYLLHKTRTGHVESPNRLSSLWKAVGKHDLHDSLIALEPYAPDLEFIEKVHDPRYLERFREAAAQGDRVFSTADCSIGAASYDVALLAAGGVMAGVDAVMNGRVENIFCVVRPPGHHAGRSSAMGFCFVNNVAVGAVYARAMYGVRRIFILDWDVHHGNGTQEIFEEDPLTYFCSLHEHPTFCFPGTGRRMDRGKGEGAGFTLNIPLKPRTGDAELIETFEREVLPEVERFRPDLILISAGFDSHRDDPIADLELTERSFVHMTRRMCEAAHRFCGGRIVSVLEGGYNGPSLVSSAVAHIKTLQGRSEPCSSASG
jgi:acetoin utilization deacetylase AcuC-like enzyme